LWQYKHSKLLWRTLWQRKAYLEKMAVAVEPVQTKDVVAAPLPAKPGKVGTGEDKIFRNIHPLWLALRHGSITTKPQPLVRQKGGQ